MKKVAILGGGLTGLTCAYYLVKKGYLVTIFEKDKQCGGLASGFKAKNWEWYLERTYHHLFFNDKEIINFAKEIGFKKFFFKEPETASLYKISNNGNQKYLILPLDSPINLLKFPFLNFFDKIRTGLILFFLKISPFFLFYEKEPAVDFLKKTIGERGYKILFQPLFRKKFGKYAENILASFFWARIKKRTKKLGYFEGGFQTFINYLVEKLKTLEVVILTNFQIKAVKKIKNKFLLNNQGFDIVISTLPSPVNTQIGREIFPADFLQNLRKLSYLHGLTLILETKEKILKNTYWLNIAEESLPLMGLIQHTNFINKGYYGGNHILYLGWYVKEKDIIWRMSEKEILEFVFPYLKEINSNFSINQLINYFVFKAYFAQPIYDKDFIKYKPNFITPLSNFYIANLDMTYPYDRGTNYAVKLGKDMAYKIFAENPR